MKIFDINKACTLLRFGYESISISLQLYITNSQMDVADVHVDDEDELASILVSITLEILSKQNQK